MTRERPILMSAPMVRALLNTRPDGTAIDPMLPIKTMTRRVVKNQCEHIEIGHDDSGVFVLRHCKHGTGIIRCPYGKIGDRLWVRETFHDWVPDSERLDEIKSGVESASDYVEYRADRPNVTVCDGGWTPSIFMPRWASRIDREITLIRVERLQDISTEDCIAEGLITTLRGFDAEVDLHEQYKALWESINGPGSWDANPWVWVIEFKRVRW